MDENPSELGWCLTMIIWLDSPICSVFFWLDTDQIIGSKPSIGQRHCLLHFSSSLMQPDGRRKRRRYGRILHTNHSLITVRAPPAAPFSPDNEFVCWVIHAEEKRCGRSPFYLAALMDEWRADLVWVKFRQPTLPSQHLKFYLAHKSFCFRWEEISQILFMANHTKAAFMIVILFALLGNNQRKSSYAPTLLCGRL